MAQTYAYARQAGFEPAAAVIAAAVAMAESGLNTAAVGDVGLQTDYWGPSVGLMQIRTVRADTGTGRDRDIARLDDPLQNMLAAYAISNGGRNWTPWTTYTRGTYRRYLGQAQGGASDVGTVPGATMTTQPASWVGLLGVDDLGARARGIGVMLLVVAAGGVLLVLGGRRAIGGGS